jgi:glutamate carboxypeptidase
VNPRAAVMLGAACFVAAAGAAPVSAAPSSAEQRIAKHVDARVPASIGLLERIVNVNSGTMHLEGVRRVADMMAPEFEALGFEPRWIDGVAWNRAGHLIAERRGRRGTPHVLLIGHLDTVFEADSPFQRFERVDERHARGPGTTDMKGGIVVMLVALGALADARALDGLSVTVVLMGDEEKIGAPREPARRDLLAAADAADIAIGFEDGDGDPKTAVVARRGSSEWRLATAGRASHSSQIFSPEVGSGAIYESARILAAFHDSLGGDPTLTFSPGLIAGGTTAALDDAGRASAFGKTNVVAESTFVAGDLRALTLEQRDMAEATMRRIAARNLPHTSARITFEHKYPPLAPGEGNRRLLELFDQASRDLGFGEVRAVDPAKAGAADVSFTAGRVDAALDGVGLMGSGGHTVEETADLATLPMNAKRVALLLRRIAGGWKPR